MESPDKATLTPGSTEGTQNTPDNRTATGGGDDLRKALETERQARQRAEKAYEEQRRFNGRLTNEVGELRRTRAQTNYEETPYSDPNNYEEAPRRSNGQFRKQRNEAEAYRNALDGFQLDLMRMAPKLPDGKWEPYYEKAVEFIKDPLNAEEVAVFGMDGNVDFRRSLRAAHKEILLRDLMAVKQQGERRRTELDNDTEATRRMAVVSGGGASSHDEMIDVTQMSLEEMQKHLQIDRGDPPSFAQSNLRGPMKK